MKNSEDLFQEIKKNIRNKNYFNRIKEIAIPGMHDS